MHLVNSLSEWQSLRQELSSDLSIGFVPTMGNLHDGHGQLIEKSVRDNDRTVVSIFVNDKQFNDRSDFINYPRTIDEDITRLKQHGVDFCLVPSSEALYADNYLYQIHSQAEHNRGEDISRPGHFTGVLTIVMKLFQLVRPSRAYFGEKDYQQLRLIKGMVMSFFMPIEVIGVPTFREADGLPFSSRNKRLTSEGRQKAGEFARLFKLENHIDDLHLRLCECGIEVEYIEDIDNRRLIAVIIDGVRLIDNRVPWV